MDSKDLYSVEWLLEAIRRLPSDSPITVRQQGFNNYKTQKEYSLGWLDLGSTTGSFCRKSGNERGARYVYNQIGEPKMLLWLASSAGVPDELLIAAKGQRMSTSSICSMTRLRQGKITHSGQWN